MFDSKRVPNFKYTWRERLVFLVKELLYYIRIDLCFDESDGFDVGAFVFDWKRARGPFLLHRQRNDLDVHDAHAFEVSPWRLMVALTNDAWKGFDDGVWK